MILLNLAQFILIVAVVAYLLLNYLHLVKIAPFTGNLAEYPPITVCVPARNEERGIEACLTSILEQDYPDFTVVVVDDNSSDATPDILKKLAAKYNNLTVITGAPLPADWHGKPFALFQAQKYARGDYIIFTDADPVFQPNTLKTAAHVVRERNLDMLSLLPGCVFGSFWERAAQPVFFSFIASLTRFRKVNSPEFPDAMGVGAFIIIKRDLYLKFGGHEALKQVILDDIGLAKLAKDCGARLLIADGQKLLSIRMYYSLEEIRVGWRKNIFIAMRKSVARAFYYIFIVTGFAVTPYLMFMASWVNGSGFFSQSLSLASLLIVWAVNIVLCKELRLSMLNIFIFPLGALVFSAIMLNSMAQILLTGKTEWRGRKYSS